ncbi:hypothetical protein CVT24_008526 [Panaeolus cyanescens]|uniref:Uncharacterized protein n=1 Tax=Panaeolus cyanescens TaxID=181874 RepID=A0A409VKW6_9AGAR|nr:hypothetical protein CVT24_008526 [Panaeolus cyanescens]
MGVITHFLTQRSKFPVYVGAFLPHAEDWHHDYKRYAPVTGGKAVRKELTTPDGITLDCTLYRHDLDSEYIGTIIVYLGNTRRDEAGISFYGPEFYKMGLDVWIAEYRGTKVPNPELKSPIQR